MKSLRSLLLAAGLCTLSAFPAGSLFAQQEPALPPGAEPALPPAAKAAPSSNTTDDQISPFDAWLLHPAGAPVPAREEIEKFLTDLKQRQQDVGKILDFLVGKKRMRKEAAAKDLASVAIPQDVTMEHWDDLARMHKDGSLSDADYADGVANFAGRFRSINWAQENLSHKCAQLMLNHVEETPVRRAQPVNPPHPAATPSPALPSR